MSQPDHHDEPGAEQPFISHLIELRDRLIRALASVLVMFLILFPFANPLYTLVAQPLMARLPEGSTMIATEVATPFLAPFRLALIAAVFLAMPYLLYQMWAFVAPGLYRHEKRLAVPLLVSSIALFYIGAAFAYFLVFPVVFSFFIATAPDGVAVMTDISKYLDFVLTLFFAFGLAFEIPIATILVVAAGLVSAERLSAARPYVIVGAFVIGAVLTPPDVLSQTMLAVPMWLLFELGIIAARLLIKEREGAAAATVPPAPGTPPKPTQPRIAAPVASGPATAEPQPRPWSPPGEGLGDQLSGQLVVGGEIDGGDMNTPGRFVPMTPEQMDAELDAIEGAERRAAALEDSQGLAGLDHSDHPDALPGKAPNTAETADVGEEKLRAVQALREAGNPAAARALLYELLEDGNEDQRRVARNILAQIDT